MEEWITLSSDSSNWFVLSHRSLSGWHYQRPFRPHGRPCASDFGVTIILSLIGWTWLARQLRGQVLSLRGQDYVVAAKLMGAHDRRLIFRHMIPATTGQIIVIATLSMPTMILAETALSFLGLGSTAANY